MIATNVQVRKLMKEMGKKHLMLQLPEPLATVPEALSAYRLELDEEGMVLTYTYDTRGEHTGITDLLSDLKDAGLRFNDLQTKQSSLQEIFVDLVNQ